MQNSIAPAIVRFYHNNGVKYYRHERYLGAWSDDVRCGPGMFVTSSGTYCEAIFANGAISVSEIWEVGRSKM